MFVNPYVNPDLERAMRHGHRHFIVPVNAGWTESNVNGTVVVNPLSLDLKTPVTANSRAMIYAYARFLRGSDADPSYIDWDKKLVIVFSIRRTDNDPEVVSRFQLKEVNTEGDLAAKGIGILVKNLVLYGEAYDATREEVNLNTTLTDKYPYMIRIEHEPGTGCRFYVNNVLAGTSTHEPSGDAGATSYLVFSIVNGATGGVEAHWNVTPIEIWQEL